MGPAQRFCSPGQARGDGIAKTVPFFCNLSTPSRVLLAETRFKKGNNMTEGPNKHDVTTREGFATAAAPLERLLLSVSEGVLHSWDLAADAVQSALL